MMAKRSYDEAAMLADKLMDMYLNGHLDRAILSYTHFISLGSQQIINETLLPVTIPSGKDEQETEYILEPSAEELMKTLLPKVIRMKVYCAVLDSYTSEQAARMIAMQAATDNADNLIDELTLQFNKLRQQAITNEILDLAGGSRN
jgi:F-type H+-transporting ATPase subunit gamma